jgi:hypothetical protein
MGCVLSAQFPFLRATGRADSVLFLHGDLTSVGSGDVVLTGPWRILASIQAANGVIIFGWTAALIFYHIQTVYTRK